MIPSKHEVFAHKFDALEKCLVAHTRARLLYAAAIVRLLLLDEKPLVHQVNRGFKVALAFELNDLPSFEDVEAKASNPIVYYGPALSPSRRRIGTTTRMVNLQSFLDTDAVRASHQRITVRDVIRFAANKAGGVHCDESRDPPSTRIEALVRAIDTEETPILANTIAAICTVVLDALRPLRTLVGAA